MSDYRREQLVTYVGGPLVMLIGLALSCFLGANAICALETSESLGGTMIVIGLLASFALMLYGIYVVHEGRRILASNHWRAEHFQA